MPRMADRFRSSIAITKSNFSKSVLRILRGFFFSRYPRRKADQRTEREGDLGASSSEMPAESTSTVVWTFSFLRNRFITDSAAGDLHVLQRQTNNRDFCARSVDMMMRSFGGSKSPHLRQQICSATLRIKPSAGSVSSTPQNLWLRIHSISRTKEH